MKIFSKIFFFLFSIFLFVGCNTSPKKQTTDVVVEINGQEFCFVWVNGGTFEMGEAHGNEYSDRLDHTVTLDGFYMGKYEVTQAQWRAIMAYNPSSHLGDDNPVDFVTWNECQEFIQKLNNLSDKQFAMPTEAQWEFAAQGGNKSRNTLYCGDDNIDAVAWYLGNSDGTTYLVGKKVPNELGLFDMSGNVWEWCQDWYHRSYYKQSPEHNPVNNDMSDSWGERVIRGGGWRSSANDCSITYRHYFEQDRASSFIGFRLVMLSK